MNGGESPIHYILLLRMRIIMMTFIFTGPFTEQNARKGVPWNIPYASYRGHFDLAKLRMYGRNSIVIYDLGGHPIQRQIQQCDLWKDYPEIMRGFLIDATSEESAVWLKMNADGVVRNSEKLSLTATYNFSANKDKTNGLISEYIKKMRQRSLLLSTSQQLESLRDLTDNPYAMPYFSKADLASIQNFVDGFCDLDVLEKKRTRDQTRIRLHLAKHFASMKVS